MVKATSLRPVFEEVRIRLWCPKYQFNISPEECRACKDHLGERYDYKPRPGAAKGDYVECDYVEVVDNT